MADNALEVFPKMYNSETGCTAAWLERVVHKPPLSMPPLRKQHDDNDASRVQHPPTPSNTSMMQPTPSPISPNGGPSHNPISSSEPSTSWPRRVSKACCSCRRDKIRCDGARPCSGCVKKGLPADKCIDGCLPCRRSRARCDGANPCTRCRDMSLDCVDEHTAPPIRSSDPPTRSSVQSTRAKTIERAKLACLACRRDNKKCDDQRPCIRCQARQEECIHVNRGPKVVKLRCSACRRDNKKCEDTRPCRFCNESNEPCSDVPRKGRGHGTRVKAACTNCRRDKIQCGNERPCHGCTRRGYECIDRTCQCAEKGPGQECNICRAQKQKAQAASGSGQVYGPEDAAGSSSTTQSSHSSDQTQSHPHLHQREHQHHIPLAPPPAMMHQAFPMMPPYAHPTMGSGVPVSVNVPTYAPGGAMALPVGMAEGGYYPVIDPSIDERNTRAITS